MELERKFGFWTGLALVIGIVIGSGIFYKADDILVATGGDVKLALLAFIVAALSMIFGALTFVEISKGMPDNNGLNDYIKGSFGKIGDILSQAFGWFMAVLYFPVLVGAIPVVASLYTHELIGISFTYISLVGVALFYLISLFIINVIAPSIASKIQVSTTIIKLIPLAAIAIVGIILGLLNGGTADSITDAGSYITGDGNFFKAVIIVAFTYEGWVLTTNVNKEIIDGDRVLPRILVIGPLVILSVYILYFLGLVSSTPVGNFLENGDSATIDAFVSVFGKGAGTILTGFILISVLGALNGLIMAGTKSFYHLGSEGRGILPSKTSQVSKKSDFPIIAGLFTLACGIPLLLLWALNFTSSSFNYWFDESIIAAMQVVYIGLFISLIIRRNDLSFIKRFVFPILGIIGASIVLYGGAIKPTALVDLLVTLIVLLTYIPIYLYHERK